MTIIRFLRRLSHFLEFYFVTTSLTPFQAVAFLSYQKNWCSSNKNRIVFLESIFHLVKTKCRSLVECTFVNLNPFEPSTFYGILSDLLGDWAV